MDSRKVGSTVVVTLCAAFAFTPATFGSAAAVRVYRDVTLGTAVRSGPPALQAPLAPEASTRARGTRRTHGVAARMPAAGTPTASPSALGASSGLLTNFNGVGSRDSENTNFGLEFEPPDQGLCAGNGYVLDMVNSAYTVYSTSGRTIAGPFNVNGPFNEGLTEFTSDPRCYYEAATHTWYATILQINRESNGSNIDIAVNHSGNPTTVWTVYRVNTTGMGGSSGPKEPGCPCFGDQPTLGVDAFNLYVTTNQFSILGSQFNGAQIYAFAKKDLVSLSPEVHFAHFRKLESGGAVAASVQPAITTGASPAEYFLNSLNPNATFDDRVGVWAMTNRKAVAEGSTPTLSSLVITSEAYGEPVEAEQKGSASVIAQDDDRMQQTQYIAGSIWGELSTSITLPGDAAVRDAAAWFQVKPKLSEELISGATMHRQGYVAVSGNYLLYPALQVAPSGTAAMVMTLTGEKHFPSAAYSLLEGEASAFGTVRVAATGTGPYDKEAERWGDYSWAALDPSGESTWLATEYVPPKSSQTTDGLHNWGTRVFRVGG